MKANLCWGGRRLGNQEVQDLTLMQTTDNEVLTPASKQKTDIFMHYEYRKNSLSVTFKKLYLGLGFKFIESAHCGNLKTENFKCPSNSELVIAQKNLAEVEASQILKDIKDLDDPIIENDKIYKKIIHYTGSQAQRTNNRNKNPSTQDNKNKL